MISLGRLFGRKPHKHERFQNIWTAEHAEIDENDPVRHTSFQLMACDDPKCRHVEPWPLENYLLTTQRYRDGLKAKLAELNWKFEETEYR
jgi:hypothetical protein